jgi:hypothetical protein
MEVINMFKLLLRLTVATLLLISNVWAQEQGQRSNHSTCNYTGTINQKMEQPERITVKIQGTSGELKEFYFKLADGKKCAPWTELKAGQVVVVNCKEKKDVLEATCVTIHPPAPTFTGKMSGGVLR